MTESLTHPSSPGTAVPTEVGPEATPGNASHLVLPTSTVLLLGTALQFAGLATSHPEVSPGRAAYLTASAAAPVRTQVSAVFLHYGAMFMSLGVLVAPTLTGRCRGSLLTLVGAATGCLFLLNLSGSLLVDWMHLQLGPDLPVDQGAAISDRMYGHPLLQVTFGLAPLIAVGLVIMFVGLVRCGTVGWWTIPAVLLGYAGMLLLPYGHPILPALGSLPMLVALGRVALEGFQRDVTRSS